jgi:phosphoribosyl 1,2-cyclic phosphodiesterase
MIRFASLGSGSHGNAHVVSAGKTTVLVDCGFSIKETEARLQRLGLEVSQLAAILVTHEHGDHIQGVDRIARKYRLPVWLTAGTSRNGRISDSLDVQLFNAHEAFAIQDLEVEPFPVPHDAAEPAQFVFSDGQRRLGLLTDTGCTTPHIERTLQACDALMLEYNHDSEMLANGPYHYRLKQRVGGQLGHLSNQQADELLQSLLSDKLQHLVAMHLSEKNNHPDLVRQSISSCLGCRPDEVLISDQGNGVSWLTI